MKVFRHVARFAGSPLGLALACAVAASSAIVIGAYALAPHLAGRSHVRVIDQRIDARVRPECLM